MEQEIKNRVADSGILQIDPKDFIPVTTLAELDIKGWLFEELILKEKDFREHIRQHNWQQYDGAAVAVYCSVDAIIPTWAYMLVSEALHLHASTIFFGNTIQLKEKLTNDAIEKINIENYRNKRIVIKGCGEENFSPAVYMLLTQKLKPVVRSIMFGEPCSTVPVYKSN
jgi:hypothetical protein